MLKFAISEQNITPGAPMDISGYTIDFNKPLRRGKSDGALDHLLCVTMLLEVNNIKLIFISLDFTIVVKSFTEEIRQDISNRFAVSKENIIVSCTHTHSGPHVFLPHYTSDIDQEMKVEAEYLREVKEKVSVSVEQVIQNAEPVKAYYSLSNINGYYGNRNVKGGPYDDSFHVIRFKNYDNKVIGSFANFSCHPTILKGNSLKFSADLLGNVRKNLSEKWNAPVLLTNGAAGDVSSRHFTKDNTYKTVIDFGEGISNQVLTDFKESSMCLEDFNMKKVSLLREYSPKNDKRLAGVNLLDQPETPDILINEVKRKIEKDNIFFNLESYIYFLGPISFITFPGECVTKLAEQIKSNSKSEVTMFVCYANDFWYYFVPEEEYGKYFESIVSLFPKGLADEFGELISDELRNID
ncbi:neutral/alkaline non-lysosomal ceramidase N-terminal domain-containing protein [Saliterribacillus persicus]|uniref:Neutral/alkaline ceramidase-like enzyme n=1 Tax=Saliterribacillus persicus TaxID=930114 RepID=A0A368X825_9BACI|nr:neutral/alkaline non-lysosomal ceramidase N-terminal domain-containing protein [Saliterribacillus persicus]RCW63138.1 neutral/alkaline ceramidase-like enzyme [Saliterribacillus persicus]